MFSIIDLHHQLATAEFNLQNLNAYIKKIKRIANKIKKLNDDNENLTNTLQIVKRISSDQIQLLLQIRSLSLTEFIIEKMMSLIHAQQIVNFQESKSLSVFVFTDKKCKTDKQLQKLKNEENQYSNCRKIDHLKFKC